MVSKPVAIHIEELGSRIAEFRLSRNMRQDDVAREAGVSRGVIVRLETGKGGTLDSLLRVLKALDLEDRIGDLIPDAGASPLDRSASGSRQRARPAEVDEQEAEPWKWGDE